MIETPEQRDERLRGEYGLLTESLALNRLLLKQLVAVGVGTPELDAALASLYIKLGNLEIVHYPAA